MGYMRTTWTEEDILALPPDEQDYFERKAGALLDDQDWRKKLAKALSAFANSGGGHIIVGQSNDGKFDGVDVHRERNPIGHWFEQIIPNLVVYPLKSFRVHTVLAGGSESQIPSGKVVVVIDIDDSPQAPHQTAVPKDAPNYYYRTGSDSKPAPHHYLEALRTRHLGAQLTVSFERISGIGFLDGKNKAYWPWGIVARVLLLFKIQNDSRQACHQWALDWSIISAPQNRPVLDPDQCSMSYPALRDTQNETILPTRFVMKTVCIGIPATKHELSNEGIFWPVHDTHIKYRAISEHHVPEYVGGAIADNSDRFQLTDGVRMEYEAAVSKGQLE